MTRSTLTINATLAVIAVGLTSLRIRYELRLKGSQDKRASAKAPLTQQQRSGLDTKRHYIRSTMPGSSPYDSESTKHLTENYI
jgi:hypothetical protein